MVADGESASRVAHYLNESGLPKTVNHGIKAWTDHNVINLIHNPIYAGTERFRQTHCEKRFRTGKTVQVETPVAQVLYREMPHLAHVSLSLWKRANDALTKRRTCAKLPKGNAHPNKGIPRDRWGPLSKVFVCGICGAPMYRDGAFYRCADCKPRPTRRRGSSEPCWNRCSPQTQF